MADPERWRNKFRFLFQREQVLSFVGEAEKSTLIFNKRGLASSLEPRILRQNVGSWILSQSAVFWILFAEFNLQKIETDIDAKERVRRQIVDAFWNTADEESAIGQPIQCDDETQNAADHQQLSQAR